MKNFLIILTFITFLISCKTEQKNTTSKDLPKESITTEFKLPEWAKNATIYEANTRNMSEAGDLKSLEAQIPRLKNMGIDIVWMMPVHPISLLKRKASGDVLVRDIPSNKDREKYLGSPYAVADYKAVNPDFGTMEDFKSLVNTIHQNDMKIIIDWVPNHTGWDNPWITEHPDWYTKGIDGKITDPINADGEPWGWTDVADLNYDNAEMREAMIDALKFWLTDVNIDGFRMDVAHGIPQDFWDQATPELVKAKSDIFLLAEAEIPSHRNNNTFHASYGWSFHHILNEIAKGEKNATAIDEWFAADREKFDKGFHMHFTSNHDENAWSGSVFERMGNSHKTMAALVATIDGIPLLYSGMEEPMKKRLKFFEKDNIGFKNYAYAPFYKKLFELKHNHEALWNGTYGGELQKMMQDENIYAFKREKNGDVVYGIFNLSDKFQSMRTPEKIVGKEVMTDKEIAWEKGQPLKLPPWQYYIITKQ